MRFRHVYMGFGTLLVLVVLLLSDPDVKFIQNLPFGAGTFAILIILVTSVLYVGFLHISRKALLDYIDIEDLFKKAKTTPEGAGMALIAVGLMMISISLVISAAVK